MRREALSARDKARAVGEGGKALSARDKARAIRVSGMGGRGGIVCC